MLEARSNRPLKAFNEAKLVKNVEAAAAEEAERRRNDELERAREWQEARRALLGNKIFKDDFDPRF